MKLLSALDALFLHLETPEQPMHVGGLNTFVLPPKYKGNFYQDVRDHLVSRMHLAPIFQRTLATMPMGLTNPAWLVADHLDLDWHIQSVKLPKPGTHKQLEALIAKVHAELLPRDRPLWRAYVIEGLKDGQTAFFAKFHHAALDGQGGIALAKAILDIEPKPVSRTKAPRASALGKSQVSAGALLAASFRGLLGQYAELVKAAPQISNSITTALGNLRKPSDGRDASRGLVGPKTRLNVAITKKRAFATLSLPMTEVKALGKVMDGSLNDAVLAIVSGGLRRFLISHDELPKKPLICAMPVSLRTEAHTSAANIQNQSSMVLTTLATDIADPIERFKTIMAGTERAKELSAAMKSGMPTDIPSLGVPWLLTGLTQLYTKSKLADRLPPVANVVVSNVMGPPVPLYMAGAAMTGYYPVSIVVHGIALNITLQSYAGQLSFGLIACAQAVPDVALLAQHLEESFEELTVHLANTVAAVPPTVAKKIPTKVPTTAKATRGSKSTKKLTPSAAPARKKRAPSPRARKASA